MNERTEVSRQLGPGLVTLFPSATVHALAELKNRLRQKYQEAYPGLGEIIRLVLEEEERRAWALTSFPHLLLPDLVEAHITILGLEPAGPRDHRLRAPHPWPSALAAAG